MQQGQTLLNVLASVIKQPADFIIYAPVVLHRCYISLESSLLWQRRTSFFGRVGTLADLLFVGNERKTESESGIAAVIEKTPGHY